MSTLIILSEVSYKDLNLKDPDTGLPLKELLSAAQYRLKDGRWIVVPKGYKTDLASIPKVFRWIIRGDESWLKRAAIAHDWLYTNEGFLVYSRKECDQIFRDILEEELRLTPRWNNHFKRALIPIMYFALRVGGDAAWEKEGLQV